MFHVEHRFGMNFAYAKNMPNFFFLKKKIKKNIVDIVKKM